MCHLPVTVHQGSFNTNFALGYFVICSSYGSYVLVLWIVVDGGPRNYR
jgi:hypothetical protein